jgi:2-phosphosulfolactate phosphatase
VNPEHRNISVLFEPAARAAYDLSGASAVVIDAIRATTTIVAAIAAGCREVVPYRTAEEVLAEAARRPPGTVVTAGERGGVRIEGLDYNNSPAVMTAENVGGRTLLLTTTNGTQAVHDAMTAETVLIAALPNRRAVARRLAAIGRRVVFVAAGTVGAVSCEDTLVAGAVIAALLDEKRVQDPFSFHPYNPALPSMSDKKRVQDPFSWHLEDSALVALAAWQGAEGRLAEIFHQTWGGAFIARLGLDADLAVCTQVDTMTVVPQARGNPPVIVGE